MMPEEADERIARKGDVLALALASYVSVLWLPLLPGLAWARTQIGLPTIPRIPEFQPETTVPSWGFAVPGFAATVLGFLIGVEFLSERFLFNMLSRARRWRNPVRYDEALAWVDIIKEGPKARELHPAELIARDFTVSRLLFGAPLPFEWRMMLLPPATFVAVLSIVGGPLYLVALYSDVWALGASWGLVLFAISVTYVVVYFFAFLVSVALYSTRAREWSFR